jgi:hypothetical protein
MHRVEELTSLLFDEGLSSEEQDELNDLLRGDPETCEVYLAMAESHAALVHDHAAEELTHPHSDSIVAFPGGERKRRARWVTLATAAVVFLCLNAGILWFLQSNPTEGPVAEEPQGEAEWIAVVTRVVDAVWEDEKKARNEGDGLSPGELKLTSGLVHIEFFSGASVVVEGPAHLSLDSAWRMACHEGKLRTFVPEPAQGFTIETPEYHAVDLGTEFALRVDASGRSELLVVDGEVRIDDESGTPLEHVRGGEGILSAQGKRERLEGDGSDYVSSEALMGIALADAEARYNTWANLRDRLASDPATLVLFDFEDQDPWDRQLENRVPGGPGGAIIGSQWGEGRWKGKGALEFQRITDRIRVRIPGEFTALSYSAWVQVNGLDRWLSSLMLTDGFEEGEVHWQMSDKGELVLGISSERRQPNTISPPVIGPKDLGRWMHLAVTIDQESGEVVHYLDGVPLVKDIRSEVPLLRLGEAEIGNWSSQGKNHPLRSFNGTIDEFMILKRVLSPGEIEEIYAAGRKG